ncbi:MAG TPA: FxLYD domain-containing protein [Flavisolibacter sp.]|jgi:hypothetical protein|nr:FxLYD domain-containing protein [Flavisolibacter sp.]
MVRYFLLRDNHETGPYTLAELKGKTLFTTDLIWVEGESTCWNLPNEISSLEGITLAIKKLPPKRTKPRSIADAGHSVSVQSSASLSPLVKSDAIDFLPQEDYTPPSFETLKEKYAQKAPQKRVWSRKVNIGANLLGMITLFIGLGLSAYMVKKAVENIEFEPVIASAEAVEIAPEKMQSSTTTHAAFASIVPTAEKALLVPDTTAASAVTSQTVSATELLPKPQTDQQNEPVQQTAKLKDPTANEETVQSSVSPDATGKTNEKESTAIIAEPEKEAVAIADKKEDEKKADKPAGKPSLQVSANKYNVGFLGGISNLEISVSNPSGQEVSKAIVEVEFLRPNGKVVGSQTVTVSGIAPGGSKTVSIPDNSRGVSVRYKVVKTES